MQLQYEITILKKKHCELQDDYSRICVSSSNKENYNFKDQREEIEFLNKKLKDCKDHIEEITKLCESFETENSKNKNEMQKQIQQVGEHKRKIIELENSLLDMVIKKNFLLKTNYLLKNVLKLF